jgi:Pentapeptide repeats (8 copies)
MGAGLLGWLRETGWWLGVVVVLAGFAVVSFFWLPGWIVSPGDLKTHVPSVPGLGKATEPTAVDLLGARNDVRVAAVTLLAGVGAALATGFAARTYYLSRRGQLEDRYNAAVEQLESQQPSSQVSAIGALERLARESPARHRQIMGVLATFLRKPMRDERIANDYQAPPGVQAACTVLAHRKTRYDGGQVLDLVGADLRYVNLDKACFRRADLREARLEGAFLRSSDLREAKLKNAIAPNVRLDGSKLSDAVLDGASLEGATLDSVVARKATFWDATLNDTFLRGADLSESSGLPIRDGKVVGAITNGETKLPAASVEALSAETGTESQAR